ncbi:hypothetical protein MSAN_01124900 [Mycena sanguinolenta]|uniref:Uncharacterized protein n=1 Tax=Mycena sanguinolenta TaxID=230812 RepID=A0A8H6YGS9_9AGAR|nr:hypothetical protein MSAN_01124900 [Mycena sanguinolenta]
MDGAESPPIDAAALQNVFITRYISGRIYMDGAANPGKNAIYDSEVYGPSVFNCGDDYTRFSNNSNVKSRVGLMAFRNSPFLWPFGSCRAWNGFAVYAGWLSMVISNFLVLLRIWTTLPRNHRLIAWSLALFGVMQLMSFAVTTWVISTALHTLVFDPILGLCVFSSKPNVFALWAPGLLFELIVFLTVCWNMLNRPRALGRDTDSQMARVLFRDGVTYFLILFILRIANTVVAIVAPLSAVLVVVYFIWAATTVTTSRLIINSRREVGKAERLRAMENEPFREGRRLRSMSSSDCG